MHVPPFSHGFPAHLPSNVNKDNRERCLHYRRRQELPVRPLPSSLWFPIFFFLYTEHRNIEVNIYKECLP